MSKILKWRNQVHYDKTSQYTTMQIVVTHHQQQDENSSRTAPLSFRSRPWRRLKTQEKTRMQMKMLPVALKDAECKNKQLPCVPWLQARAPGGHWEAPVKNFAIVSAFSKYFRSLFNHIYQNGQYSMSAIPCWVTFKIGGDNI